MKRSVKKKTNVKNQHKNLYILIALVLLTISGLFIAGYSQYSHDRQNSNAQAASSGWLSGASCNVLDGSFATWRGSPVTIAGTWDDGGLDAQVNMYTISSEYGGWTENLDVTIGAFWGTTWANAANGGDDAHLHAALAAIDKGWGSKKTIFIRYAHEFNGNWDSWKVLPSDNANYIKAFDNFYKMVQTDLVAKGRDAKVVWSPNSDDHNGIAASDSWPGDQYVDVVGVDWYDWDHLSTQAAWDNEFMKTGAYGGPYGVGAWQAFAKAHGKPLAFPEWGTTGDGPYDDPFFIQQMNNFFRTNAGTGPGQVWYEIYFDCTGYDHGNGENFLIYYPKNPSLVVIPNTASMYKSLKWGDGGLVGSSPTQPAQLTPTTPNASPTVSLLTPTLFCAGSNYCVPSTTITPTGTDQVTPTDVLTQTPSDTPDLNATQTPGDTVTSTPGGGGGGGGGGNGGGSKGLLQLLLQFISMLLALLMKLFGK